MKKGYLLLFALVVVVLGSSQMLLWKDQQQMWQIIELQSQIIERMFHDQNRSAPFVYEDEMPENFPNIESIDI